MIRSGDPWLADTNILLRFAMPSRLDSAGINAALDSLRKWDAAVYYTSQNMSEFWNVCTRPIANNGFGLSLTEVDQRAQAVEERFRLAEDNSETHYVWRRLVVEYRVSGSQVHDARIAATMLANGIANLLTLNGKDFRRFAGLSVYSPADVLQELQQG